MTPQTRTLKIDTHIKTAAHVGFALLGALILMACSDPAAQSAEKYGVGEYVEGDMAGTASYTSDYTGLDLDGCYIQSHSDEGAATLYKCMGYQDMAVFVEEVDGRFNVDLGALDDDFVNRTPFNSLGDQIEWRLKDGQPIAGIVRYHFDTGTDIARTSELAVISVGGDERKSCYIGWVPAGPDQNERARQLADREGADFSC